MTQQINPDSPFAHDIYEVFRTMGAMQRDWQDQIGFGEEGHRLRQNVSDTQERADRLAGHYDPGHPARDEAIDDVALAQGSLRNYYMAKIGLVMTEGAEALDEMREHDIGERYYSIDDQGNPKPEGVLSEFADVVIRIWSLTGEASIDLGPAIIEKLNYNATRAQRHGGKAI